MVAESPVGVLVVDDQEPFRKVVRELIDALPEFELVGEATSGADALSALEALSPQFVIVDKRMPGLTGIETARLITARRPGTVVLIVSLEEPDLAARDSAGAAAFVRKQELSTTLLREVWREHGS
ncbi:MAG: response regulator transcription factor [Thermoleophilaceae bacterium]